jgi:peptide chain release factor
MTRLLLTSGTGPVDVRRSVAELWTALAAALPELGYLIESEVVVGEPGAPGSVELVLHNENGAPSLSPLLGTHAFVRPRSTRGRKRWYVGVKTLPALPADAASLDPRTVHIRADRAGGPGGQHVNTTATAVRATHLPSGLSVRVARERSQARNRAIALALLQQLLTEQHLRQQQAVERRAWLEHHRLERGRAVVEWRGPVTQAAVHQLLSIGTPARSV